MSLNTTIIDNEPFIIFKYTNNTCLDCYNCMEIDTRNMSSQESNKICCGTIRCILFWPLCLVGDILSCPFRGCIHLKNKK